MTVLDANRARPVPAWPWLAQGSLLVVGCFMRDELSALALPTLSRLSILSIGVVLVVIVQTRPRGLWSVPSMFAIVAALFHAGLLLSPALGVTARFGDADLSWFYSPTTRPAIVLVTLALVAYGLGVVVMNLTPRPSPGRNDAVSAPPLAVMGFVLLTGSVAAWFAFTTAALGPTFILSSYPAYLSATAGQPLPYISLAMGMGLVLVAASGRGNWVRWSCAVFATYALFALPLGLRGEVLFPAVAAAAVLARNRRMPSAVAALVVAVSLLALFSVIREVRSEGLSNIEAVDLSASPLDGLGELGATLRLTTLSLSWHDAGHEPYRHGTTYLAPIERPMSRLLGQPVPPAISDSRLMNVEVKRRVGGIGGSFIAEAHHNFGLGGVLLIPFGIGCLLCRLDRRTSTILSDGLLGVVLLALLQHVRNSFAPVPLQIAAGLLLLYGVVLVARIVSAQRLLSRPEWRRADKRLALAGHDLPPRLAASHASPASAGGLSRRQTRGVESPCD